MPDLRLGVLPDPGARSLMQGKGTMAKELRVLIAVFGIWELVDSVKDLTTLPTENWGWELFWGLLGLSAGAAMLLVVYRDVRASKRNPMKGIDAP